MNKVEEGVNGRRGEAVDTVEINMDDEDTTYCGSCISTVIFIFSAILIVCTFPFSLCVCIKMVQVWNYSFSQTFTRPVDQKAVTHLIFFVGTHWFQKYNFWKNSLSPFWGRRGRWGQTTSKLKIMKILNENPLKIDEIQNLASATSKMASWPRGSQKGLSEFFQKIHFLNQGKALRKMSYSLASWSNF